MKNSTRGRLGLPPDYNQPMVEFYNGKRWREMAEQHNKPGGSGGNPGIGWIFAILLLLPLAIMSLVPACIVYFVNRKMGSPSFPRTYLGSFIAILIFYTVVSLSLFLGAGQAAKIEGGQLSDFLLPLLIVILGLLGAVLLSALVLGLITGTNYLRAFWLSTLVVIPMNLLFKVLFLVVSAYQYFEQQNEPIPTFDEIWRIIQELAQNCC